MPKFMKMLNNISRSQAIYRHSKISADDLHSSHYSFVLAICRAPGRSQEEITQNICLNKSTVARSLAQLEENAYVVRIPKTEDKRCLLVYPTEKMYELMPTLRTIVSDWYDHILEGISEDELEVFQSVLVRIEQNARRATTHGGGKI